VGQVSIADGSGYSPTARSAVSVATPSAALLTDVRFPVLTRGVPVQFFDYQGGLRTCHDTYLAAQMIAVTVGSSTYTLPATKQYWDYLHGLIVDLVAGAASVPVVVASGVVHTLTAAQFEPAFKAYRAALRAVGGRDQVSVRGAIESSRVIADLDAITIG
jgi:hypothetical protein